MDGCGQVAGRFAGGWMDVGRFAGGMGGTLVLAVWDLANGVLNRTSGSMGVGS